MKIGIEMKKVDKQGRLVLPKDWRSELGGDEVFVVKEKTHLKIIPKTRLELSRYFDAVDLGVKAIGDWKEFERRFSRGQV
jgi:bifunctional DNA-binding transcriptional regulator/antitoxin component of YhaV-PrlF toxin-antitoxin module